VKAVVLNLALFVSMLFVAGASGAAAQSSDQNFPTPVTASEVRGTIRARDIGDSRLTTHFYAFDGEQGDVFINVQSRNFDGDIDVFTASELRPLTKIVVYSDAGTTETGRVIYLRKGEHLLLRVEGRSPDDNAAVYSIKFAGSFVALDPRTKDDNEAPRVQTGDSDGIRLNAVGAVTREPLRRVDPVAKRPADHAAADTAPRQIAKDTPKVSAKETEQTAKGAEAAKPAAENSAEAKPAKIKRPKPPVVTVTEPPAADPLASIILTIQLKNGRTVEKPMSEVLKFSTDKGVMTIITKDGSIARYLITDVLKVTIQ